MTSRSIIVTGGFGALGRVVAAAFAKAGDHVARVDFAMTGPEGPDGVLDIGGVDLTDAAAAAKVADQVSAAFGGIDALINIAGGCTWETLADGSIESW